MSIGLNLRALVVYLLVFQHVPVQRCQQLIEDVAGARVSAGFIHSCLATAAGAVGDVVKLIKTLITAAVVAGFDETTLRAGPAGTKKYVLGAFTERYSALFLGQRTLESFRDFGILPQFSGVVVSDRYQNYFHDGWQRIAGHQACCSHLIRDFEDAAQCWPDAIWPGQVQRALRGLIRAWHAARHQGLPEIPAPVRDPLAREFRHAVLAGLSRIRGPELSTAQHPGRDLLEFCHPRQDDVPRVLLRHPGVASQQHQRAWCAAAENPAEDLRPAHQQPCHPGPARHPQLHRHRPRARPGRAHRAPRRHDRHPVEPPGPGHRARLRA